MSAYTPPWQPISIEMALDCMKYPGPLTPKAKKYYDTMMEKLKKGDYVEAYWSNYAHAVVLI